MAALEAGAGLPIGLAHLLLHAYPAALGTGIGHRLVPGGEVARRVADAAPERLAPLGTPFGEVALDALGALDPERDGARALARGIGGAGEELAEPAGLDDHGRAAQMALLVGGPVGRALLLERLHVVAGVLVLDAREIRPEPSGLELDRAAAL